MIMVHPDLVNAYAQATVGDIPVWNILVSRLRTRLPRTSFAGSRIGLYLIKTRNQYP